MNKKLLKFPFWMVLLMAYGSAWAHFPVGYVTPTEKDGFIDVGWTPVQLGIYTSTEADYHLQLVPGTADVYGAAAGFLNLYQQSAFVSFATVNSIKKNYLLEVGPLLSVAETNYAFQTGLFCFTGRNHGVSAGLLNLENGFGVRYRDSSPMACGIQIGLVNIGGGIQIGLFNFNPKGPVQLLPLLNFPCRSAD